MSKQELSSKTSFELEKLRGNWPLVAKKAKVDYQRIVKFMNGTRPNVPEDELIRMYMVAKAINSATI